MSENFSHLWAIHNPQNIGAWREFSEKLCAHAYGGEWRL